MALKDIEILVFDLDYTLIDSSEGIVYCFNEARRRVGEPEVTPDKLIPRIGIPIEDGFKVFGSSDPVGMRELFREIARDGAMANRSFLLDDVADTLPEIRRKGYRMAVASTKSHAEIVRVLEHLGIVDYFEEFVGSDEVEYAKPAPDPLLLMMKRTGVDAQKMVYVGDHVVDIRSARAAGTGIIVVLGGPCSPDDVRAEKPDYIIENFKEITSII